MCGICGTIGFDSQDMVSKMNAAMIHRGPDSAGIYRDKVVCLGHTRLAIIDLSSLGNQPMSNNDESLWITFNGEIYNFIQLKDELIAKGHSFRSKTDTEVVLHLYEEFGIDCLKYMRGMFAFAVWDKRRDILFAARDRLGEKPFFYYYQNGKFIFASELKALVASGQIKREINENAVRGYLTYGAVQSPQSLIKGIYQLLPGHYLTFNGNKLEINRYWGIYSSKSHYSKNKEQDDIKEIHDILGQAVRERLTSDVPLGAFLSGGIDSSALVALMQKNSTRVINTFSVVFEEASFDEGKFSREIASKYGCRHREIKLKETELLQKIPAIFEAMDQPSIDGFNSYIISQAVKNAGVTVAVSGLGGDELFGGYPLFKTLPRINKLLNYFRIFGRDSLFSFFSPYIKSRGYLKSLFSFLKCNDLRDLYCMQRMVFLPHEVNEIVSGFDFEDNFRGKAYNNLFLNDVVNQLSYLEMTNYLPNMLLADTDRMSMANSLEVRAPFLDHKLVEKLFEIPGSLKVGRDYPKRLLVKAMGDLLPENIYQRPKQGFVLPFDKWLKGGLRDYCEITLARNNIKDVYPLNAQKVNKIWTTFLKRGSQYNYSSILSLLSYINWYKRNVLFLAD